jgi:hypothetical protein
MVKSYKMLVLLAMLNADRFPGAIAVDDLAGQVERLATRTAKAGADLSLSLGDRKALIRLLEQNPIAAWTGGRGTGGVSYFDYAQGLFRTSFNVDPAVGPGLQELVRELADWRLTEYLDRAETQKGGFSTLKVSHASGTPMLFLPPEPERTDLPAGWTDLQIEGRIYSANFVKVAINVVRRPGEEANELPGILRGWFGPDAGAPGTRHAVALEQRGTDWHLTPLGQRRGELQLWRAYSREEIPPLFDLKFSTAIWNVGFVKRPGHIFLLATLNKSEHGTTFQYKDHFMSPEIFQWQSQNRTGQSGQGEDIQKHAERGIAVHLFVRAEKKSRRGGAAPFVYCGDVDFVDWDGEKPITVRWRLREAVPATLRASFDVPESTSGESDAH